MSTSFNYKDILVGVDPKGLAVHAVARGHQLAQRLGSQLHLSMALQVPAAMWPGIEQASQDELYASALEAAKAQAIQELAPGLREEGIELDLERELHVHLGHPGKVILQQAKELGADLVLIGHHAQRSLLDFGSTARAVFSRASLPVWIQGKTPTKLKTILLPVDLSETSTLAAQHALALAKSYGAAIHCLHSFAAPDFAMGTAQSGIPGPTYVVDQVREASQEAFDSWLADFAWDGVPMTSSFVEGEAARAILDASQQSDLVVMGTQGHTGLARFFLGGVAYGVIKLSETPVLAIPSSSAKGQLDD